jgi:ATP synthase protein I
MKSLALVTSVVVTVIGAVIATIATGTDGTLGALAGGAVVVAFLGSTPLLLKPVVRASTTFSPVAALGFFTVKAVAVVALLVLLFDVGGASNHVDRTSLGLTAMAVSFTWTAAQTVAFRRDRTPTYDLDVNE